MSATAHRSELGTPLALRVVMANKRPPSAHDFDLTEVDLVPVEPIDEDEVTTRRYRPDPQRRANDVVPG